jgi:hypothetical protein
MGDVEAQLRRQFLETFEQAEYPIESPFELIPHLSDGPATEFQAGDVCIPAIELGTEYGEYQEFPYESVDQLATDILEGLKQEDVI